MSLLRRRGSLDALQFGDSVDELGGAGSRIER
ncbi:Uncharacterised protein [Mycobacteroides abscessus subsp. abscessus]|nr:Uncharacterised protein [Mycobacteroides abscessus subsp. abscessus]